MNKICICHNSEKTGQTSVMCCNVCGLPDEDFWQPSPSTEVDKEDIGVYENYVAKTEVKGQQVVEELKRKVSELVEAALVIGVRRGSPENIHHEDAIALIGSSTINLTERFMELLNPTATEGQPDLVKYANESFNETARIYGKVKRVAKYGGSIFIIFEDDTCYRLQWQSYKNDTITIDASQPQEVGQDELEIIDGYVQIAIDRKTLPEDGKRVEFITDKDDMFEGYFVGGDDLFWVNESTWFAKWYVHQWKYI